MVSFSKALNKEKEFKTPYSYEIIKNCCLQLAIRRSLFMRGHI